MPVPRDRDQMPGRTGPGWTEVTCASSALFGSPVPMVARDYSIGPAVTVAQIEITGAEAMGYVEAGSGIAEAGGEQFRLEAESMLWLSGAGLLTLTAGPDGLKFLLAESASVPAGPAGA